LGREVIFFDHSVRPDAAHELVFAEDRTASVEEGYQCIERPTAEFDRATIGQQLAAIRDDLKSAKFNADRIFRPSHREGL